LIPPVVLMPGIAGGLKLTMLAAGIAFSAGRSRSMTFRVDWLSGRWS
jgi:hypothetical protein